MRIHGQEDGPASAEDREVFKALHLAGSGKVRATVEERTLCLENKRGHALDVRLSSLSRVHHHHTRLIPFSFALIGVGLIWMAQRILVPPTLRMFTAITGACLIVGWFGTRKPTLTLDTESSGSHTLTGHDSSLMRLSTLLKRLQDGMSLEDARIGLDIFDRETAYPRDALASMAEVPVEPVHLHAPVSIGTFLIDQLDEEDVPQSVSSFDMFAEGELELDFQDPSVENMIPGWLNDEPERIPNQVLEHGLLQRGIANAHDRRSHHSQHAIQPQAHQNFIAHQNTPIQERPIQPSMPSYQQLLQATQAQIPAQNSRSPSNQYPSAYLPSFVGRDGAHIPGMHQQMPSQSEVDEFRSPDSILLSQETEQPTSLIENARRDESVDEVIQIPTKSSGKTVNQSVSRLRPKDSQRRESRLRPKRRSRQEKGLRVRDLVLPSASQLIDNASEYANRLVSNQFGMKGKQPSSTTDHLRQRSSQTHQSEAIESIYNLAESRGGNLPDEEIARLNAHMTRRDTVLEQQEKVERAPVPELEDISFGDLKDSEQHYAEHAGKSGLPRIDF